MSRVITAALVIKLAAFSQIAFAGSGDSTEWIPWPGKVPRNAVRGGVEQGATVPLYVCRANTLTGYPPRQALE